jgi:hypothetical protein
VSEPTEARATQRAAEAARIHEQLHAITRLSSRRWTYEIDGVEMTYKLRNPRAHQQGRPGNPRP